MGNFYFDESIQDRGNFIIGAFVYSEHDLTHDIFALIQSVGLKPGVDEFKSCARMSKHPEQGKLRNKLKSFLDKIKIGLIVLPRELRDELGNQATFGLSRIVFANQLNNQINKIYFDEGIKIDEAVLTNFKNRLDGKCSVLLEQDSKLVGGIQLADLVAHSLGIMLLEELGLTSKKVRAGEKSSYDPDSEMDIGFELWATLRHSFFMSPKAHGTMPFEGEISHEMYVKARTHNIEKYGLYIAPSCTDDLKNAVVERFATNYLGCIH